MPQNNKHDKKCLLGMSLQDKMLGFKGKILRHRKLDNAITALCQALKHSPHSSIIYVFGPSGVGKTTLMEWAYEYLIKQALHAAKDEASIRPIIRSEIVPPDTTNFNWKDLWTRTIMDINGRSLNEGDEQEKILERIISKQAALPGHTLRRRLEQAITHRKVSTILYDEAQHLRIVASGQRLLDQMDILKSLVNVTGVRLVLFGTYELLHLANLSGQLSRRSKEVWIERYYYDSKEDSRDFKNIINSFQQSLPLIEEPQLVKNYEFIYEKSLGCVGILKEWLYQSLAYALENNEKTITQAILEKTAYPNQTLVRMAKEAMDGELLKAESRDSSALKRILGIKPPTAQKNSASLKNQAQFVRVKKVGKQKPRIVPIGPPNLEKEERNISSAG